jgi:hypothetical protein
MSGAFYILEWTIVKPDLNYVKPPSFIENLSKVLPCSIR